MTGIEHVAAAEAEAADDPQDCPACVAVGDLCLFHLGFAEGWDTCAELLARVVTGDA